MKIEVKPQAPQRLFQGRVRYQDAYFVLDSFDQVLRETASDFAPIYARLRHLAPNPLYGRN